FLTGHAKRADEYGSGDSRQGHPRFQGENFDANMKLVGAVKELAAKRGCTPGQLAIAWLLHRGDDIVPIPGTKRRTYLRENLAAADVTLSDAEQRWLDERLPVGAVGGERYTPVLMSILDGSTSGV